MARTKPKKSTDRNSAVAASIKQAEENRLKDENLVNFNFSEVFPNYSFEAEGFSSDHYIAFCEAIQKISTKKWKEVSSSPKHSRVGREYLEVSRLLSTRFQQHVSRFTETKFLVLRYFGNLPMVGVRQGDTFLLLGMEAIYDDMYIHNGRRSQNFN